MSSAATAAPRLGFVTKVSYGLGAAVQGAGGVALATATINFYLVSVVGLRPALVGLVIFVSLVIDAVVDPVIGRWSDTFRSRWGRRHPFMYASALPIALAVVFFWRQPAGWDHSALAIYALAMLIVVRLAGGLYTIPSDALAPELAPDYHARTTLISFRWFFGIFAAIALGLILNLGFLRQDKSHPLGPYDPTAYANFGILAAVVIFVAIIVSAAATHRYIKDLKPAPLRRQSAGQTVREIVTVLSNRSLLAIMASGLVSGVATGIGGTLERFMSYDFWGLTPQILAVIGLFVAIGPILAVFVAPFLSRALDKKRTMITVFTLSVFTGVIPVSLRLLGLLPPNGSPVIPIVLAVDGFVAAILGVIGFIIVGSMIADVVEDAAVKTGVRAEGLLFSANGLLPKVTTGIGFLVGNMMLEFVHFPPAKPGQVQLVDPAIMHNLALISLPTGAVLNLIAIAVLGFYRIDRKTHEANLEALRLAAAVTEPPAALPAGATDTAVLGSPI